ncbi:MAG: PPC domain-containing DNA-binding protein [Bradymonadaceae bacterium]
MLFQETTRSRRIVGRLDEGDECIETLEELCAEEDVRAGELRAVGRFDRVEVVRHDAASGDYVSVLAGEGAFDVISLKGNVARMGGEVAIRTEVLLSTQGPAGPQVVAGKLQSGRVVECEFVLDVFADLEIERRLDNDTGLLRIGAIHRTEENLEADGESEVDVAGGRSMDWEDAVEESETAAEQPATEESGTTQAGSGTAEASTESDAADEDPYADVDFDVPAVESGDLLEHPKLGRCRVIRVEAGEALHVRLPRGKIRKLSLDYLDVEFAGEENNRNVFEAEVDT